MPEGPSQCSVRLRGLTDGISRSHRVVAFANAFRPTSNPADSYSVVFEEEEDAIKFCLQVRLVEMWAIPLPICATAYFPPPPVACTWHLSPHPS